MGEVGSGHNNALQGDICHFAFAAPSFLIHINATNIMNVDIIQWQI